MDITVEQLSNVMKSHPVNGIVTRQNFNEFCLGGCRMEVEDVIVIVSHNFKCLEPYSPNQKIELSGVYISVFLDNHRSKSSVITDPNDVLPSIRRLKEECKGLCEHKKRKELSYDECCSKGIDHSGMWCHVYECQTCKEIFAFDSSG